MWLANIQDVWMLEFILNLSMKFWTFPSLTQEGQFYLYNTVQSKVACRAIQIGWTHMRGRQRHYRSVNIVYLG